MTIGTLLVILLVLAVIGTLPIFPFNTGFGYGPSSILGAVLVIVLVLVLFRLI